MHKDMNMFQWNHRTTMAYHSCPVYSDIWRLWNNDFIFVMSTCRFFITPGRGQGAGSLARLFPCLYAPFVRLYRQVRLDFSLGRILPNGLWLASGAHASVSPSAADWTPRGETHIQSKEPWDCWPDTKLPLFGACTINDYVTYGIMVK